MFWKLLTLVLLIFAVWYGFRTWERVQRDRQAKPVRKDGEPKRIAAEDMNQCPVCGIYVPQGAPKCGRPGCPQG